MGAIGLNPIRLDRIGLDPIRINAIKLGVPGASGSDRPYIDPEVLASLKAVCICYGKSNDDPDRAIIKNLVDPDNPFVISNAAFKLNSGFGKYETELSDTRIWTKSKDVTSSPFSSSYNGLSGWIIFANTELTNSVDIPSIKIEVKGLLEGQELIYRYYDSTGQTNVYSMTKDGEYTLPADVRTAKPLTSNTSGFQIVKNETNTITITQIPSFEGALVTDGVNDLITSTKTVQEMLGGSNEITVVSMIRQLSTPNINNYTNTIRCQSTSTGIYNKIAVSAIDKTGIYGYSFDGSLRTSIINNILGDKQDYSVSPSMQVENMSAKFLVQGWIHPEGSAIELSSVAWYWTIIANKVLTTDQINQVIAYFNLDRTLKPDILCDVKKQGITNDNHAEFGDKLIDFSNNGRDIQLNNIAWDGDSGIGKYNYPNWKVTATIANTYSTIVNYPTVNGTYSINVNGVSELMQSIGLHLEIRYTTSAGFIFNDIKQDGVYSYILPDGATDLTLRFGGIPGIVNEPCNITITQIPSHAGGLCLDGINDFGKVTGMPVYKDYTVAAFRKWLYGDSVTSTETGSIVSKSKVGNNGAFIFEQTLNRNPPRSSTFSFGTINSLMSNDKLFEESFTYQTKYSYNGNSIQPGTGVDSDSMWLGVIRDGNARFSKLALWSLMLFPYSLSEFLIERQLKKHKLGTLYPDMVEFRPIVKSNLPYSSISYSVNPGEYISVDSMVTITVTLPNTSDKLMEVSCNAISDISISGDNGVYEITGKVVKSPQKINLVISSYLTMLSNSTLISNETLIKNE